jgi:hypothetical protein
VQAKAISAVPAAPAKVPASLPNAGPEEKKIAEPVSSTSALGVDRATIARIVEAVLAGQGITRGSGAPNVAPVAPAAKEVFNPSSIAAEIASRFFTSLAKPKPESTAAACAPCAVASPAQTPVPAAVVCKPEPPAKPAVEISPFVSENDVRRAMTRSEKIFIGPKTILTPSARDLGLANEVFVETEAGSLR